MTPRARRLAPRVAQPSAPPATTRTIAIAPEDLEAILAADKSARRIVADQQIVIARAQLAVMEAKKVGADLIDALAEKYHFDARKGFALDEKAKTVTIEADQ